MITIIAIGKKHEDWVRAGIDRYETRLKPPFNIKWELLPHSSLETEAARREESQRIVTKLSADAFVILLDERGAQYSSEDLSLRFESQFNHAKNVIVVIGGAYGVDNTLHTRANMTISLSKMVFPHQLVRLILAEQIYRAQAISHGSKYHHA